MDFETEVGNRMDLKTARIGVIGGTGKLGLALAGRLARAGCAVVIGSRDGAKAQAAAAELGEGLNVTGADNAAAAQAADLIIVTVPFSAQDGTLAEIAPHAGGKIVVDTTVPLAPPAVSRVSLPPEGSAALRARALLGADVRLVSAFHNVAAHKLAEPGSVDCDVLVFGDDAEARGVVTALAGLAGLRGLHAGMLVNSAAAEALTSVLIFMNRHYRSDGAGVRITAVDTGPGG
jgi:NADPH-dependent F420 reductase